MKPEFAGISKRRLAGLRNQCLQKLERCANVIQRSLRPTNIRVMLARA